VYEVDVEGIGQIVERCSLVVSARCQVRGVYKVFPNFPRYSTRL
jgi:hypothetical protein